ncbi:MAG TPA: DUF5916 domain-containing protein, partial [Thermoanaerobaculia bacterium]|nr:DUF5916 domain-containing protein [Thermoanaerobaculia bacterium]
MSRHEGIRTCLAGSLLLAAVALRAASPEQGVPIPVTRAAGPIAIDGNLSDAGWQGATKVTTWYETNPGDSVEPKVKNVGYLTYDDKFLYAGFEFTDPNPPGIRAPYGDRDNVSSSTDYGGIILDTHGESRRAILFLANPRGIQYDANTDDATGEDSSPDYYWDSAARITSTGWVLELRVPFSSLRYKKADPQKWNIMLYRNHPRDFRYQYFSTKLPRGGNCFICRSNPLTGLTGLPSGGHLIVAPYVTAGQDAFPEDGLGTPLENEDFEVDGGLDVKWTPGVNTAIDATLNPDFSQVESDVAQIGANERFALFFPEKRPFFLESIELFSTELRAVYTRTITSPRWGARATGKFGHTAYTVLVADDRGGGSVILPGPNSSSLADQDFESLAAVARVRHELGASFVSFLATDREIEDGGHNRVFGPDFRWTIGEEDTVTGQILLSQSETPERPDLAEEWDGRKLSGHAGVIWWSHSTRTWDWFTGYWDFGDEFRADNGFIPQVGYRETYGEVGHTWRPTKGFLRRLRAFAIADYQSQQDGALIFRQIRPGAGMDGLFASFLRFEAAFEKVRAGDNTFDRNRFLYQVEGSPSGVFNRVGINGFLGDQVDFANSRPGKGGSVTAFATVRPTDHLEFRFDGSRQWLDVETPAADGRLFTATVARLRTQYTFNARAFLRVIGQWVETERDPSLYTFEVSRRDGDFSGSVLLAYKLNWQSVLFLGYGDNRAL